MAKAPKPIRIALEYDSYRVEGDTEKSLEFHFDAPHIARLAFAQHLAKAKKQKRLAVTDTTRVLEDVPRAQLQWDGDRVTRAWFTADELDGEHARVLHNTHARGLRRASEQLAAALKMPAFAAIEEIGIGLERWEDSHRASFDIVLDALDGTPLRALAFGDYDNTSGHLLRFERLARIAEVYPALEKLRITTTRPSPFEGAAFPKLQSLSLRTKTPDASMRWCFDLPALRHLTITVDHKLLAALVAAPVLPRLESLTLLDLRDDKVPALLRKNLASFKHLELRLDETARIAGLDELRVALVPSIDRYRDARE